MIKDFPNTEKLKMVSLVFFYISQLPHTVISNSEKLTHPIEYESGGGTQLSEFVQQGSSRASIPGPKRLEVFLKTRSFLSSSPSVISSLVKV